MKVRTLLSIGAVAAGLAVTAGDDATVNGGFEETTTLPETHGYLKPLDEKGWIFDRPTVVPKGWIPNPSAMNSGEFHLVNDKAQAHSGNVCIFLSPLLWF